MSSSINIFQLEQDRIELINRTLSSSSNNLRLHLYSGYIEKIFSQKIPLLEEAYLPEVIEDYLSCLQRFDVWGTDPSNSLSIIELAEKTVLSSFALDKNSEIQIEINRLKNQIADLNKALSGNLILTENESKALFPMLDFEASHGFYGILESVSVRISRSHTGDKFIIIPSEKEIEKQIHDQCKRSWYLALQLAGKYIKKPYSYHEVLISFDRRDGFYEGNSLGISLTLTSLEALLNFYNSAYIIKINDASAFTGGISANGEIYPTGEDIINKKIAAVFFSTVYNFVFSKNDEQSSNRAENILKSKYPDRKLNLIPIKDINDVLNRRDLVDIRKQKITVRAAKMVRKNWISAALVILLTSLLSYYFSYDFDDNPASLASDDTTLFVKNSKGRVLWTEKISLDSSDLNFAAKIIDIDDDGNHELVLVKDDVRFYNKSGKNILTYHFDDKVFSPRETLNTEYNISILDTITFNGSRKLFLWSTNGPSFSSAIFNIDLTTGERAPGTLWCSGHIVRVITKDIDNDDIPEIIGVGYDNGFEDIVFFVYELNPKTVIRPTTSEYSIKNFPAGNLKAYIRFPKTDYDILNEVRTPNLTNTHLLDVPEDSCFHFATSLPDKETQIGYRVKYNLRDIDLNIGSAYGIRRDSAVAQGKIISPFKKTDSDEYKNEIKKKILYWNDNIWVHRENLD